MQVNYTVVFQNTSMGNELKWLLREGDVGMFSRALSLENRPTPFESRPTLFKSRLTRVLKKSRHNRFVM